MTAPASEEVFLRMMREALKRPALSLEQAMANPLAELLLQTLAGDSKSVGPSSANAEVPLGLTGFAGSRAVIRAAIEDTFDMGELNADPAENAALLDASDLVTIAGVRRLRLKDAARAEVLSAARGSDLYERVLDESVRADSDAHEEIGRDPVRLSSAWLRCLLSGEFRDLDSAPPSELKAALAARDRLRLVADLPPDVPSSDELARRVGLAELLEPLRVLIGAEGGWDGTPRRDRFVGREDEVTQLRAFVDELGSQSVFEYVSRASARAFSAFVGSERPGLLIIEARGGLGKSALLAKFVLDHALDQSRQFPFAYLDFDRATLNPERPHQILLEISRQIALQYPKAYAALSTLGEDIRAEFAQAPGAQPNQALGISDPFSRFSEIVREHATFGRRALLLVFDTMEVVQWDPTAIERLAWLIDQFRLKGLDELRVVASGRADIPEFRQARGKQSPTIHIKLKPLRVNEARTMADKLGYGAIGDAWRADWSKAIVEGAANRSRSLFTFGTATTESPADARREPLAVRVAVDLIVRADPAERAKLAAEVARMGIDADDDFIARLYEKRIVNHVRDAKAKKLAWPGLVIRRITTEIATEVLAPLCGLSREEAKAAFTALGQEVWMVTREGEGALRHLAHLRARTLPLMRKKDKAAFFDVARAAVDYHGSFRQRSREDCVEWVYYRLLAGEEPDRVDADVPPDIWQSLASAVADFAPQSAAASFIASRTERKRLSPRRIRQLRPRDALYHLSVAAPNAFALDDVTLDATALELSDRLSTENHGGLSAWARALWIKTGAWRKVRATDMSGIPSGPTMRAHMYWSARVAPSSTDDAKLESVLGQKALAALRLSKSDEERFGFDAMVQALAIARLSGSDGLDTFEELDMAVARALQKMRPNPLVSIHAALRTAIVLGQSCQRPALSLWLASRRRGSFQRLRNPTFSLRELRALNRALPDAHGFYPDDMGEPRRFEDEWIVATASHFLDQLLSEDAVDADGQPGSRALARVFACRDEDWIVPLGYAAARATAGRSRANVFQRLRRYLDDRSQDAATTVNELSDTLSAMFIADEAGDLVGFAQFILETCGPDEPTSADLAMLIEHHRAWTGAVDALLGSHDPASGTSPEASRDSDKPPAPGQVVHPDDPQKGRWGGKEERAGRKVHAVLESTEREVFYFSLVVESTDGSPLMAPVTFHLHHTYPRSVATIRRIIEGRQAVLSQWNAYGVFAVGVQVRDAKGKWVSLEIDLADLPNLPKRFLKR